MVCSLLVTARLIRLETLNCAHKYVATSFAILIRSLQLSASRLDSAAYIVPRFETASLTWLKNGVGP
jgi:hypothetical protein